MNTFGDRLAQSWETRGRLCVGIDPHDQLLDEWGLPRSAAGVREFGFRVVDAAAGSVGIVKPQVAFFERFGSAGFSALETVLARARQAELLVIADAKRGDVGSTMTGYAEAWLTPGSPLEADSITLNPYQGVGSLEPALTLAARHNKGVFVLAATSNPEGTRQQLATIAPHTNSSDSQATSVAAMVLREVAEGNRTASADAEVSSVTARDAVGQSVGSYGVVIGATLSLEAFGFDEAAPPVTPVLAPGFGAQGATLDQAAARFGSLTTGLIVAESRSVLSGSVTTLAKRVRERAEEVRRVEF